MGRERQTTLDALGALMPSYSKDVYINGTHTDMYGNKTVTYSRRGLRSRTTNVLPSYWSKKRRHEYLATCNYVARSQRWTYPVGYMANVNRATGRVESSHRGDLYIPMASSSDWGDIQAASFPYDRKLKLQQTLDMLLLADLKQQKINLGQAFAERKQTVRLIESTALRLYKAARAARRGDFSSALKALGTTVAGAGAPKGSGKPYSGRGTTNSDGTTPSANRPRTPRAPRRGRDISAKDSFSNWWLEQAYGWRPLLNDVYAAMDVFSEPIKEPVGTVKRALKGEFKEAVTQQNALFVKMTDKESNYVCRKKIDYTMATSDLEVFTRTFSQLGLTNPLDLAWELLYLSFVVDWFLPIGNYLKSLDATVGLQFLGGWFNEKEESRSVRATRGAGPAAGYSLYYKSGAADDSYADLSFSRVKVTSFPSSVLPSFRDPLGVRNALSALSLLNQFFKKG